jgi:hypothetical protein
VTDRERELERMLYTALLCIENAKPGAFENGNRGEYGGPDEGDWLTACFTEKARAFLASSPAQEEKRYTLAEVEAADRAVYGDGSAWDEFRDALKETP